MNRGGESGSDDTATAEKTDDTGSADEPTPPRRRRRRWLWISLGTVTALLLLAGAAAAWAYWRTDQALSSIDRIPDALPTLPEVSQPPRVEGDALVYLLVGVDNAETPDSGQPWQPGEARSDTMMLLQIAADRRSAWLVSLPRDTWVEIPDHGEAKLNAAYSWGGPPLMIQTIQDLTDIRIDHLAVIDWSGFRALTDAVGGVMIDGERLDGRAALDYVRERKSLAEGDLDRTRRQQNFLRSLLNETLSTGTLTDPGRLNGLLDTVGDVISVDDRLSNGDLRSLAWDLRSLRGSDVHYMNAPVAGTTMIDGQSVVLLDEEAAAPLWEAMRTDSMPTFTTSDEAPAQLGPDVR
ncbi:LCP family protein [Streptomyces hainanensis]|uniref:LytR family transcriptional regulator n=1 Tax=Streptomyces hainanensis TaxID=402648 RepID=A0A4R4TNP7_9ACTN|nr:LCP family protein [Streptomyces hainanensis]TDC79641.1 LytR family transcriptional regulator [Streptomyces hainanensis]